MEKLREYRQRSVGISIGTLKLLVAFSPVHLSGNSHHRETTQSVNTANKSNILSMIGVLTERYFRPDLRSKKIKLITRTNPTTKSTKKQTLNKTTIFYNEVGNKSASGKYFVKFCVCVITIGLLFSVISTFIVPLGM